MANNKLPRKLPLLVVSDGVLLPGSTIRIPVATIKNINLVRSRISGSQLGGAIIGVITKEPDKSGSLREIGTAGVVVQVTGNTWPRPSYTLLVTGLCRFQLLSILQEHPYPVAAVKQLDPFVGNGQEDGQIEDSEVENLLSRFKSAARKLIDLLDVSMPAIAKLKELVDQVPSQQLADAVGAMVKASLSEKLQVLDAIDIGTRLRITLPLLLRHIQTLQDVNEAQGDEDQEKKTRGGIVRVTRGGRRLSPVGPLDSQDDEEDDITELETKIEEANMPEEALKAARKELSRLKRMPQHVPEFPMIRSYLDLLTDLPWSTVASETCDINKARLDLDQDHYGLEKVKKRILEYLAVRQLRGDLKGPILCFVGPPGVGKTSIAKSIGTTLGRPYTRMSLGGISDQHDIRGHRRTYIGAMPGRIIQALRKVKVKNPVLLLDEVDKLGQGMQGDPASALLEVLDPEQNSAFTDTYVNLPFDLSQVLFVATANSLSTIPSPLLDRMEIINIPGYTQEEKVMISQLHLIPKQLREHGLNQEVLSIPPDTAQTIIGSYTREAGVRSLERKIGAICRHVAVKVAEAAPSMNITEAQNLPDSDAQLVSEAAEQTEDKQTLQDNQEVATDSASVEVEDIESQLVFDMSQLKEKMDLPIIVDAKMVQEILGAEIFQKGLAGRVSVPGVAVGLAWTPVGGELLVVEASRTPGEPGLNLTGQLGSVMQESAKIALSWVRQHANMFGLSSDFMREGEIHIHFPAGAISKDGPSAGVTIITVLVSLLCSVVVRNNVAMTGEVTLNGIVLPVGGIKEKVMAAQRGGLTTVIIPAQNKKDLVDIPQSVLNDLDIVLVNTVEEVLMAAFEEDFMQIFSSEKSDGLTSKL